MGNRYLTEMANWLRAAGVSVIEDAGWQTRGRSSGGFDGDRPWMVMWHHTASDTSPGNDVNYITTSEDAPIANILLARDGTAWICAGGATNTNGKGQATPTSRGTVPKDSMNTHAVSIEIANNGVGEPYPQAQIDAAFTISLALATRMGLSPRDACEHQVYAPDRKIDPATAAAVQGPWRPSSTNSSGTWDQSDLLDELNRRTGHLPDPTPTPPTPSPGPPPDQEVDMLVAALDKNGTIWIGNGQTRLALTSMDVFNRYVLIYHGRLVNASGDMVTELGHVAEIDDDSVVALGNDITRY